MADIPEDVRKAAEVAIGPADVYVSWVVYQRTVERVARAILADRGRIWAQIDLSLLDFPDDDPDDFGRGHAHAKGVVRSILSPAAIRSQS